MAGGSVGGQAVVPACPSSLVNSGSSNCFRTIKCVVIGEDYCFRTEYSGPNFSNISQSPNRPLNCPSGFRKAIDQTGNFDGCVKVAVPVGTKQK